MMRVHADFETRSAINLKTRGAPVYFEHHSTIALLLAYQIDDGAIALWRRGEPEPPDLRAAILAGAEIHAHNASFERRCFAVQARQLGWAQPRPEQFHCSMATAAALGLPRSLEKLGEALQAAQQKDKTGAALIQFFCVPIGETSSGEPIFNEPADHPLPFAQFAEYCRQDVAAERAISRRMIPLSEYEHRVWLLDQKINARGIRIDRVSAVRALGLVEREQALLDKQIATVTGGSVKRATEVAKLTQWLQAQPGVSIEALAKDDVLTALKDKSLPAAVVSALEIRQQAAKSSTSKLKALLRHVNSDDRLRDMFNYNGAGPGRWCLAEGSLVDVKTKDGVVCEKPIESVLSDDLVWDGDAWVAHDGVVFSGEQEVISHDGVTATSRHIVYIDDDTHMSLGEAKRRGIPLYAKKPKQSANGRQKSKT